MQNLAFIVILCFSFIFVARGQAAAPPALIPEMCQDGSLKRKAFAQVDRTKTYSNLNVGTCTYGSSSVSISDDVFLKNCLNIAEAQNLEMGQVRCEPKRARFGSFTITAFCNKPPTKTEFQAMEVVYYPNEAEQAVYKCRALSACLETSNLPSVERIAANEWFKSFDCTKTLVEASTR